MKFETQGQAAEALQEMGKRRDDEIDLAEGAFALALQDQPGVSLDRYRNHIEKLCQSVRDEHAKSLAEGGKDDLDVRIGALNKVIHDDLGYRGDSENYDDLQNANLIRVIDRRRGLPVALSLLYLHAAARLGWAAEGLSFPGHFIIRLECGGERRIIDPFHGGRTLEAPDLRNILKRTVGDKAELSHLYYTPVPRREILLRLENNLKTRLIANEDYAHAARIVDAMRALAPAEYRLYLDAGVLQAKLGNYRAAADALETYIEKTPDARDRYDAAQLLDQIREMIE